MRSIRSVFIRGLGAAVTLAVVAFCSLNAQAEVVFGNLESAVDAPIEIPATEAVDGRPEQVQVNWLAQSGDLGMSSQLALASVTLGLIGTDPGTIPLSTAILASRDEAGAPPVDASDVADVEVIEEFMNSHAAVDPNAAFTLVLSSGSWQISAGLRLSSADRTEFGRLSARSALIPRQSTIPQGPWSNTTVTEGSGDSDEELLSMEAVPEPSSAIVAGFGILGVAVMHRRRRRA